MAEMIELAERLEAATRPDPELDMAISETLDVWWMPDTRVAGPWTQSLDAAMTLVPEGMPERGFYFTLEHDPFHGGNQWTARFDQPGDECGHGDTILGTAATPALALCAAALRSNGGVK